MCKIKVTFSARGVFNRVEYVREEMIVEAESGSAFSKFLNKESDAFHASMPQLEREVFENEGHQPLHGFVDADFFVDEEAIVDVFLS